MLALLIPVLPGACAFGVPEVVPLTGSAPDGVMLAPAVGDGIDIETLARFDVAVREAIERRGYATIPVEVARRMLEDVGWSASRDGFDALPIARLGEQFGVDAVLTTAVAGLQSLGYAEGTLRVEWTLRSRDGAVLWSGRRVGSPQRAERRSLTGPIGADDPFFSDEPILGREPERWTTATPAQGLDAFVDGLVADLALTLPRHPRSVR